jgi:hypothetical protein
MVNVNESWAAAARYLSRYRGALLGGIGSAAAVALTLDPSTTVASSSIRFAFWFAMSATVLAVGLTTALTVAEYRASRPSLPRAQVRRPQRGETIYTYN